MYVPQCDLISPHHLGLTPCLTAAGILITRLVGRKIPTADDGSSARFAYAGLLDKLVDAGVKGQLGLKLLGDLTTNLENLASDEGNDQLRLDLWRIVSELRVTWPILTVRTRLIGTFLCFPPPRSKVGCSLAKRGGP